MPSTMNDLAQWLREQLDADEDAAHKAAELCGCHPPAPSWSFHDGDGPTDGRILVVGEPHPTIKRKLGRRWNGSYDGLFMAGHIVRHDPAQVLRDVEADRQLLAAYTDAQATVDAIAHPDMYDVGRAQGLEEAVRHRAVRFDQRPGYREEWRP